MLLYLCQPIASFAGPSEELCQIRHIHLRAYINLIHQPDVLTCIISLVVLVTIYEKYEDYYTCSINSWSPGYLADNIRDNVVIWYQLTAEVYSTSVKASVWL